MQIIKRNQEVQNFDFNKIMNAIRKVMIEVNDEDMEDDVYDVALKVSDLMQYYGDGKNTWHIEEIQDIVEDALFECGYIDEAKAYIKYRYDREQARKIKGSYDEYLQVIEGLHKEQNKENSNKDKRLLSTQRDALAGIVSKRIVNEYLYPKHLVEAHNEGIIHMHDSDYLAQKMTNCGLVNIEDMFKNGTVINNVLIERPNSFTTACNVATQVIAQVANSQYGFTNSLPY